MSDYSGYFVRYVGIVAFGIVIVLLMGSAIGQPVLLTYVETGSMSPAVNAGDGFIAIPEELSESVDHGDVVIYNAEVIEGGGLTTHRIVDSNNNGYITRGDANTFTDQSSGEPPVKEPQIVAKALQINGQVVVLPHLGTTVKGIQSLLQTVQRTLASVLGTRSVLGFQGLAYLFFATTLFWYAAGILRARDEKSREREQSRTVGTNTQLVVGLFAALLVVGATAAMVGPAGTQEYGVVSAEFDSERPTVIPQGESNDVTYPVGNGGVLPVVSYLEPASEGVAVSPHESRVGPRSVVNATVTLQAPPETGYYRRFIVEHRYLAILPLPVIQTLYVVHPWAPIVVIDAVIGLPFYLLGVRLVGTGRIRNRSRDQEYELLTRLRRLVGRLY